MICTYIFQLDNVKLIYRINLVPFRLIIQTVPQNKQQNKKDQHIFGNIETNQQ